MYVFVCGCELFIIVGRFLTGTNGKPIYIGLKRDVFDVSSANDFYGEGSGYV
jgi:predicted heme/steroid binding protein